MWVNLKTTPEPLLRVDVGFATLLDITHDDTFVYEFVYTASVVKALRNSANIVKITIRDKPPQPQTTMFPAVGDRRSFKPVVDQILRYKSLLKDVRRDVGVDVIATGRSDLTSMLPNNVAPLVARPDVPAAEVLGTQRVVALRSLASFREKNISPPVLQTSAAPPQPNPQGGAQTAALDLIFNSRTCPSTLAAPSSRVTSTNQGFSGVSPVVRPPGGFSSELPSPADVKKRQILDVLTRGSVSTIETTFDRDPLMMIPHIADVPRIMMRFSKVLMISRSKVGLDDFYATFDLVDSSGTVIDTMTQRVPHNQLVRTFSTPKLPPKVAVGGFQFFGRNTIELQQIDPRASKIRLYRRMISNIEKRSLDASYDFIAEIPVSKADGLVKFNDIVNNSNPIIYRAIAVGPVGFLGFEFTNAVSPAVRPATMKTHRRRVAASIAATCSQGGMTITVTNVSPGPVSMVLLRADKTTYETQLSIPEIADPIRQIDGGLQNSVFFDDTVEEDHIYEYSLDFIFIDGSSMRSTAHAIQKYTSLRIGAVEIDVSNLRVSSAGSNFDVTFNVTSLINEQNLDGVKIALERQGLSPLFVNELINERDRLQNLFAHGITRINLTTGAHESFGTFTGTQFTDSVEGRRHGVRPLEPGSRYKYVITTLLRNAETMFDSFKKQAVDPITRKPYSYNPAKFRHPVSLKYGTLVTRDSFALNHAEDDFAAGSVGNSKEIDVQIEIPTPKIQTVIAERIDRTNSRVHWDIEGPGARIDYFVVVKELLGMKQVVGKVHHVATGNSYEFIDALDPNDIGELTYYITPVLNDFTHGIAGISNKLTVADGRT